jgi:hypothetical protein
MGAITTPRQVLLIVAASSRYEAALEWGQQVCQQQFGPVEQVSEAFDFTETRYYERDMGTDLKKQFWTFSQRIDPGQLPATKIQTNSWEARYAELARHPEPRPLNLDPGYLTLAKLVLASTKDHAHRLYVGQGIFAEITLSYRHGAWQAAPWTYPDYQRSDFQAFFTACREQLREP